MYKCPSCGIEHEFTICPYCGTPAQRQASPSSLRLRSDAANIADSDDEQIKLTGAASERLRKNSRDGHRPPPAPKNQPTLLRDVSPVFTPDPSFTMPEEPEFPKVSEETTATELLFAENAPDAEPLPEETTNPMQAVKDAPAADSATAYRLTVDEPPMHSETPTKEDEPDDDDAGMTAFFAAAAAQLTAAAKAETDADRPSKPKSDNKGRGNSSAAKAVEDPHAGRPSRPKSDNKGRGDSSAAKAEKKKKPSEARSYADYFDNDPHLSDVSAALSDEISTEEIHDTARESEKTAFLPDALLSKLPETDFNDNSDNLPDIEYILSENKRRDKRNNNEHNHSEKAFSNTNLPDRQSIIKSPHSDEARSSRSASPEKKSTERISASEFFTEFFRLMLSGRITEAMALSANEGVYYGLIFGIIGIAAGAFGGLTGMKLIGTNAFATLSSAIGGGIILRLETLAVLTLLIWIIMLTMGDSAKLTKALSIACVSTLPTGLFALLAYGASWLYQPLALPVLLCSVAFTALALYSAVKALGIIRKKGGFIFFGAMLSVYFILTGLIIGSML